MTLFSPHPTLHQEVCTSLLSSSTRGQTEETRTTSPQSEELIPHHRKPTKMKRNRIMSQMKEKDKSPEKKKLNEVEMGNLPEKLFRLKIVNMI